MGDWITKGTCQAGDVRVSFLMRKVPNSVSVLGLQIGNQITPYTYSNGRSMIFLKPALMDLQGLLASTLADEKWWNNLYRLGVLFLCLFGGVLRPHRLGWLKIFVGQLIFFSTCFAFLWLYFYGIKSVFLPTITVALLCIFL